MADLATPSAAAMFDGSNVKEKKSVEKPDKPDEDTYKATLKKAEKDHADSMTKFNAVKAKLDLAQPNKAKDSPSSKRRADLLSQLKEIRETQAGGKAGRNQVFEQIKKLDEQLKSRMAEQKAARSRVSFKNVAEIDNEIARLEKQVNGGLMKIVDEKKALGEVSNLRKQRKGFAGLDDAQKGIDDTKAKIKALKDGLDDPESKALSEKYSKLQTELDAIKAEQDDAYKSINSLRDERTKLYNDQQEKYAAIKKLKDDYYQQNRAVQKYEFEARQRARERQKQERENFEKEKRKDRAQKLLAEAGDKAYLDEIRRAEGLLRFLDPSYTAEKAPLQAPSQFQISAQRTVDDSSLKGGRIVKKEEEDYFAGTGGKKNKKGRKTNAEAPAKYSCPPAVMEDCAAMGIEPPMSAADIESVREKVKAKITFWKQDQDAQTERNVSKAKKEVERLDAEDLASGNASPAPPTPHANGEGKGTASVDEGGLVANEVELIKKAVEDVANDLKGAAIEDAA